MILTGIKALYKASSAELPDGLSRRVSLVTTSEELAALLEDVWPAATSKSVTNAQLEEALLNGLLTSVSGEPQLVPEKERKVQEQTEGNRYVGIHVALGMDDQEKRPKISAVIEGGPADRAGVKRDDLIEQIEGADTKGMSLRDAVDRLRGDEGTKRDDQGQASRCGNVADLYDCSRAAPAANRSRAGRSKPTATGIIECLVPRRSRTCT